MSFVKWTLFASFALAFFPYICAANSEKLETNYEENLNFPINKVWAEMKDYNKVIPCLGYKSVTLNKSEGNGVNLLSVVSGREISISFDVKHTVKGDSKEVHTELLGNPDFEVITTVKLISLDINKTKLIWKEVKKYHPKFVKQAQEVGKLNREAIVKCIGVKKKEFAD